MLIHHWFRASVITDMDEYYIDDDEVVDGPLTRTLCPHGQDEEDQMEEEEEEDLINNTLFPSGRKPHEMSLI